MSSSESSSIRSTRNDDENDERPLGIFRIDSEINKSLKGLKELFSNNRNNDGNVHDRPEQQQSRKSSLLVFCPPSASARSNNSRPGIFADSGSTSDDEEDYNFDQQHGYRPSTGGSKKTNTNANNNNNNASEGPSLIHQEYLSLSRQTNSYSSSPRDTSNTPQKDRYVEKEQQQQQQDRTLLPDPIGQSPIHKGVAATPMIKATGMRPRSIDTTANNPAAADDKNSPRVGLPGLVPSTPMLSPVVEEEALTSTTSSVSRSRGILFKDDNPYPSDVVSSSSATPSTEVSTMNEIIPSKSSKLQSSHWKRSSFVLMVVLTGLMAWIGTRYGGVYDIRESVGGKLLRNAIWKIQATTPEYMSMAKTNTQSFLLQHTNVDIDPALSKIDEGFQYAYHTTHATIMMATQEAVRVTVEAVGEQNIESIQQLLLDTKDKTMTKYQSLVESLSSIDFMHHYRKLQDEFKARGYNDQVHNIQEIVVGLWKNWIDVQTKAVVYIKTILEEHKVCDVFQQYYTKIEQTSLLISSQLEIYYKHSGISSYLANRRPIASTTFENNDYDDMNDAVCETTVDDATTNETVEESESDAPIKIDDVNVSAEAEEGQEYEEEESETADNDPQVQKETESVSEQETKEDQIRDIEIAHEHDEECEGTTPVITIEDDESESSHTEIKTESFKMNSDDEYETIIDHAPATTTAEVVGAPEEYNEDSIDLYPDVGNENSPEEIVSKVALEPVVTDDISGIEKEPNDVDGDSTDDDEWPENDLVVDNFEIQETLVDDEEMLESVGDENQEEEGGEIQIIDVDSAESDNQEPVVEADPPLSDIQALETDDEKVQGHTDSDENDVSHSKHVLDDAGLNEIRRRMENARLRMHENSDDSRVDNENTKHTNKRSLGLLQWWSNLHEKETKDQGRENEKEEIA